MNTGQRIAILLVGVVVLAGAFVLFQGSGDEEPSSPAPAQTTAAATTPEAATSATEAETTPAPAPAPRVETIRIRDNRPAGEVRTLRFEDGDTIRLRFTSNVAAEVHIHGYDEYVDVPAGGSQRARFAANAQGVFEVEDHGTGELLAKLEVRP